jgi:hypothetical protein
MTAESRLPDELARIVAAHESYADWDALHETLSIVRRDHPFARAELDDYPPFWVASKLNDIREIAGRNDDFRSGLAGISSRTELARLADPAHRPGFRSIVAMNEPDHKKYRMLTQDWFQKKGVARFEGRIRELAREHVARLADLGGEGDFVKEIGVHYPLLVVMAILGVPAADEAFLLRLTQEYFGSEDDDLRRAEAPRGSDTSARGSVEDAVEYFRELSQARRREPQDDLATIIAHATVDGVPISDVDAMGYYITVAFAGHDTTASSVAGGLWALAERPDQLARVRSDPSLVASLVEEAVRWTTPIHQFTRISARDTEAMGRQVAKGDQVILCFPSGNRDEEIFEAPFEFRVDRNPNRHIGFGFGAHMCLGVHLARLEMAVFFEELLPRLESLELADEPRRTVSNFVGGPKTLPIRFRIR